MYITDPGILGPSDPFSIPLEQLIEHARAGCLAAGQELTEYFRPTLECAIRSRQHRALRPLFDVEDHVQNVWVAFFALPPGRYLFRTVGQLGKFLQRLAHIQVGLSQRRHQRRKRDCRRQVSLADAAAAVAQLADQQPRAEDVNGAEEEWQQLLDAQPGDRRQVLVLLREGKSHQEIGQLLGRSPKTVQRFLGQLKGGRFCPIETSR